VISGAVFTIVGSPSTTLRNPNLFARGGPRRLASVAGINKDYGSDRPSSRRTARQLEQQASVPIWVRWAVAIGTNASGGRIIAGEGLPVSGRYLRDAALGIYR